MDLVKPNLKTIDFWLPTASQDLLEVLKRHASCRFLKPPQSNIEADYQDYFLKRCTKLMNSTNQPARSIINTSATAFLDGRKPDVTMYGAKYKRDSPLVPMLAQATIEVKTASGVSGSFTASALGEALTFGERMLFVKSFVPEVTCAVTDCYRIQFFRIRRNGDVLEYACTAVELLSVYDVEGGGVKPYSGLQHLWDLFNATEVDLKAEVPTLGLVQLDDYLGAGSNGEVFAGRLRSSDEARSVAVKVFTDEPTFSKERGILKNLPANSAISAYMGDCNGKYSIGQPVYALISSPVGQNILGALRRTHILQIVNGLRVAHKTHVHCDINPSNLVLDERDLNRAVIIDWGSARLLLPSQSFTSPGPFAGTMLYAPPSLLDMLANRVPVMSYTIAMDLESLVLSVLCMVHPDLLRRAQEIKDMCANKDMCAVALSLKDHWPKLLAESSWPAAYTAYQAALKNDYDALIAALTFLLPPDQCLPKM